MVMLSTPLPGCGVLAHPRTTCKKASLGLDSVRVSVEGNVTVAKGPFFVCSPPGGKLPLSANRGLATSDRRGQPANWHGVQS